LLLRRRRRRKDRLRACLADRGVGVLPPVFVRPAVAIARDGCRRRRYGRRRHCVLGVVGGQMRDLDCAFVVDVRCTELEKNSCPTGKKILWHATEQST